MDTPEKTQIGTPISKFEESPFSNFANNLSPIRPVKNTHISQTFGSLSFMSPPSVFTSPHVNLQKESRFLRRHQVSELVKAEISATDGNKVGAAKEEGDNNSIDGAQDAGPSTREGSAELLDETSKSTIELPRVLKYDSGSPDYRSSGTITESEPDTSVPPVNFVQDTSTVGSFGALLNSQEMEQSNDENASEWENMIIASDLLVFDSPKDAATLKKSYKKSLDEETTSVSSILPCLPTENVSDRQKECHPGPVSCDEPYESQNQCTQPSEANEQEQIQQTQENLPDSFIHECITGEAGEKSDDEGIHNLHRGFRRRCLVFEIPGARRNLDGGLISSMSVQYEEKIVENGKQLIKSGSDSSRCILPGIGLHLNALAVSSKGSRVVIQDALSSEKQQTSLPGSSDPYHSPTASQDPLIKSSTSMSLAKDMDHMVPVEAEARIAEDASEPSAYVGTEEINTNSPKKKRRKSDNAGEGEACKRCNCKKSKCLKLYCECFAAGVYCVEPCSCQDCFNKPIHEDTVLATRKQIESRNPLAFAPKVIRTSDLSQDLGDDSTTTPASARHKRGCNCKKSSCLKKYCECYQGGVGCSINCRCEGCKNVFGRKDGSALLVVEAQTGEAHDSERNVLEKTLDVPEIRNNEEQNLEFTIPRTPLGLLRSSFPLPTSSKGKPPRSSFVTIGSSSGLHSLERTGRSTFLRSQPKIEKHIQAVSGDEMPSVLQPSSPPSTGIKSLSPNSKRISPPHNDNTRSPTLRSSRKLILQSIPSFPSLTPRR